jgi:hypothetical protein
MNIKFQGKLSKKEFRQAVTIQTNLPGFLKWLFGGFGLLIVFGGIYLMIQNPVISKSLLPGMAFPIVFFSFPFWLPEIQVASFNQPGNVFREGLSGTISDEGIAIQTSKGNTNTFWNAYKAFKQTNDLVMLYQNKNCFNIFTRGMFSSTEDWDLFCNEVGRRLKKNQAG